MLTRDEIIVQEYLEGLPVPEIARNNQLGDRRIYQILHKNGIDPNRGRKALKEPEPLSALHARIGRRLYEFYWDKQMLRAHAANRLGWSSTRLRSVEQGTFNLTLFELQDIAGFLNEDIARLLES